MTTAKKGPRAGLSRRALLGRAVALVGGGALAAAGLPGVVGRALAASGATGARRRFVFVVNRGGWDPLTVLAPMFGRAAVAMPPGASAATAHGIPYVDHAQRPGVRAFMAAHAQRMAVVQGVSVRSVSHDVCQLTMMTGAATGGAPDFATRVAQAGEGDALPHLVVSGPVYPGALASLVARTGATGQLQDLVTGDLVWRSDRPVTRLSAPSERLVEDFVQRRTAAWADAAPGSRKRQALREAVTRAERLEALSWDMSFAGDGSFPAQIEVAVSALALGVAQCVTISPPVSWDTHTDSDNQQSALWEALFVGLKKLMDRLAGTTVAGRALLEDTVVVVTSEMGRTPQLNSDQGRDHWPWTVAMVLGAGVRGGRVYGGYDAGYAGVGVDPASGDTDAGRAGTSPAQLGATLLALAGLDPGDAGVGVSPIAGMLA
ncbi:MAG: DUF1501 domain-containing protein [Deltaproteobacteria bacterium]|nr:DUF1501 domain-containing protein [Deltaproteobacteria bacterium]